MGVYGQLEMQKETLKIEGKTGGAVRFGTHKSAWERLGTDNFFSRAQNWLKNRPGGLRFFLAGTPPVVGPPGRAIQSKMQKAKVKIEEKMGGLPNVAPLRQVDVGVSRFSEKRRIRSAAVQDAGAIHSAPVGSTQVVGISSKMAKMRVRLRSEASASAWLRRDKPARQVVSRLISRRLGRKSRIFEGFLTRKGVDFSPVTKIPPDFFCRRRKRENEKCGALPRRRYAGGDDIRLPGDGLGNSVWRNRVDSRAAYAVNSLVP
jgi:hypothetical protein